MRLIPTTIALCCCLCAAQAAEPDSRPRIILDTDLGNDCDDAGALAVLHALADRGEIEILAVGVVNGHEAAVPLCDAINTFYGRPDLPLGTIKGQAPIYDNRFDMATIAARHPHDLTRDTAPDVIDLYRQTLAAQPDHSVTLVVIGQATNIAHLLASGPDVHSPLSGKELMARKIALYAAGGNGRNTLPDGSAGWNYANDIVSAAYEMEHMPDTFPTVFTGGAGLYMYTGQGYEQKPSDHIVRECYRAYFDWSGAPGTWGRQSWDELRLYYASRPQERALFAHSAEGTVTVDTSAKTITWHASPDRGHSYANPSSTENRSLLRDRIEELMMHEPGPGDDDDPVDPVDTSHVRINFQPADAPTVSAWLVDAGSAFGDRQGLSYGWLGGANGETRDREYVSNQLLDTLNHMQNLGSDRVWEIALPNGDYQVQLMMGDPRYADQTSNVFIEDQLQADPDGIDLDDAFTATVTVADGRLTIRPGVNQGAGAKIRHIEITALSQPDAVDLIGPATPLSASAGWDLGGSYALARLHDDNNGTEAHAQSGEEWLVFDLGGRHALSSIRVNEDNGGNYSLGSWRLLVDDGAGWQLAVDWRSADAAGWHEAGLADIPASRIRLECRAPAGGKVELFEVECLGLPLADDPGLPPSLQPGTLTLRGSALDPDGTAVTVTVAGQAALMNNGQWSIDVQVEEGSNVFEVIATDADGETTVREIFIEWTEALATGAG